MHQAARQELYSLSPAWKECKDLYTTPEHHPGIHLAYSSSLAYEDRSWQQQGALQAKLIHASVQ